MQKVSISFFIYCHLGSYLGLGAKLVILPSEMVQFCAKPTIFTNAMSLCYNFTTNVIGPESIEVN